FLYLRIFELARGHMRPVAEKGRSTSIRRSPLLDDGKGFFVMNRSDAEREIDRIRDAIDRVDEVIVRLLNQRAKYAIEIGEIKGILGLPIYAPEREKDVLHHVEKTCEGPLDASSMRRLFERIIDESRSVERRAANRE